MCTSQLSDASSAVWMRLSGTRSRSALRRVTWTTSRPSSPGVRSISPVSAEPGQHAVGVVVGAPADVGHHAGRRASCRTPWRTTRPRSASVRSVSSPTISISTSRRPGRHRGEVVVEHLDAAASASPRRAVMPSVNCVRRELAGRVHLDAHHRRSHVRKPIRGQEDAMTAATDLAVAVWPGIEPRLLRQGAESLADYRDVRRIPTVSTISDSLLNEVDLSGAARPRRRGVPAGGQAEDRPRQRPSRWRCGGHRQRRRGRTGVGQGPMAAAASAASGARRAAAGGADGRRPSARTSTSPIRSAEAGADRARRDRRGCSRRAVDHRGDGRTRATSPARRRPRCGPSTAARPSRRTSRRARSKRASAGCRRWSAMSRRWRSSRSCAQHGAEAFRAQGTSDVAGDLPRDDHRRRTGHRRCTSFRTAWRSPNCSSSTVFRPIRCAAC